jgi:hypothetical protein
MGNDTSKNYVDISNNIMNNVNPIECEKRELEKREMKEMRETYAAINLDIYERNFKVMPIDNKGNKKR